MNRMLVGVVSLSALLSAAASVHAQVAIGPKPGIIGDPIPLPRPIPVPAPVQDLQAINAMETSITLTWTAPSDPNSLLGNVLAYDIRYSEQAPGSYASDEEWFADAMTVIQDMVPAMPGEAETLEVAGLASGKDYYFALKSTVGKPYYSTVSNIAGAMTTVPPPAAEAKPENPAVEDAGNKGANSQGCANSSAGSLGLAAAALVAGLTLAGRR